MPNCTPKKVDDNSSLNKNENSTSHFVDEIYDEILSEKNNPSSSIGDGSEMQGSLKIIF